MNKIFKAFTLSEVLIALVIIGVVSAITVPTLMNNINGNEYRQKLRKNFSNFTNAFNLAYGYDYNDFRYWDYSRTKNFLDDTYKTLSQYLYVSKYCGYQKGCFSRPKAKNGNFASFSTEYGFSDNSSTIYFILNDGTQVGIDFWRKENVTNVFGVSKKLLDPNANLVIAIDVNGDKKPNTTGKDVFAFVLTDKGLVPAGADNKQKNCNQKNANHNYDCTATLMTKPKI